jgi:hypothetical protein
LSKYLSGYAGFSKDGIDVNRTSDLVVDIRSFLVAAAVNQGE